MEITKGNWEFYQKDYWCEVQIKEPLKSICAININVEEHIANGKLIALAPELLKVCQNALRDVKAINEWMVEKGHHGYTLLERDLQAVLEKTKT